MTMRSEFKKQKLAHVSDAGGSDGPHIPEAARASKNREDALLNVLAENQRRKLPGLGSEKTDSDANKRALSADDPAFENATDGATAANARLKNYTLPKLTKELEVLSRYDVRMMSVISSTKIRNKVQQATQILTSASTEGTSQKPIILALTAREGVASKLITIAEITKRNLDDKKMPWFQYSCVEPKMVEIERKLSNSDKRDNASEDDSEDGLAFETMLSAIERKLVAKPKFRAVPVMSIFLSRVPVKELKDAHGVQNSQT
ncbi:hypothetical protein EV356DRAFT_535663 [Viridothelium virens]|uniref:DNA/RNA-binding protein Alba-like domain-containing protein n=1 Tax=Viridothelium virens TaxID=1048519 RepID=A0A6A6H080_VIRVR|nr:hypothetical protein EV356DRAFT_535663 [Viridothelium virens]